MTGDRIRDDRELDAADCDPSNIEVCRLGSDEWRSLGYDPFTAADCAVDVLEHLHENGLDLSECHRDRLRLVLLDGHE